MTTLVILRPVLVGYCSRARWRSCGSDRKSYNQQSSRKKPARVNRYHILLRIRPRLSARVVLRVSKMCATPVIHACLGGERNRCQRRSPLCGRRRQLLGLYLCVVSTDLSSGPVPPPNGTYSRTISFGNVRDVRKSPLTSWPDKA
jgi:hypothetical protein